MPWRISSAMSQRHEFVLLATQPDANIRQLCRRFGIASATAYKWIQRFETEGLAGLADRSRRPHHSPTQTAPKIEAAVVELRRQHPAWGGHRYRHRICHDRGSRV
jgi:transposase-like protein